MIGARRKRAFILISAPGLTEMQPNDAEKQEKSERGKRSLLSEHGAKFDTGSGDFTPPLRKRDHGTGTISSGSSSTLFSGGRKKRNKINAANNPIAAGIRKSLWKSYLSSEI